MPLFISPTHFSLFHATFDVSYSFHVRNDGTIAKFQHQNFENKRNDKKKIGEKRGEKVNIELFFTFLRLGITSIRLPWEFMDVMARKLRQV